jgi:hypothetical protein
MHRTRARSFCILAIVLVVGVATQGTGLPADASTTTASVTSLPPTAIRRALAARGELVRTDGAVRVERVDIDSRLAQVLDPGEELYRVTVDGRFPPRALRYEVRVDGRPVAYGIPRADQEALLAITTDAAVLADQITVRYESGPTARAPSLPSGEPSPLGGGSLGAAAPGPFEVTLETYDFGDRAFQPAGLGSRVELRANVHHPSDLSAGPFPLVLFLHGNHSSCFSGRRSGYEWPCRPGWEPIPNHEGYDYLGKRLASWGYIVVSVSGNGVNVLGNFVDDTGMRQRGLLLEKHIDLWNEWNAIGGDPFDQRFVGAVDMDHIGVMGHSRGGEGAVWNVIEDRRRANPYDIDAVLPLAPVDFTRETVNEVHLGVILPFCDGDVSDLQGVHFFDDARYLVPGDPSAKATVTAFGANHNFFNTVWSPSSGIPGAFDDGYCPGHDLLTERQQRRVGIAYMVSFFRRYVGGETDRGRMWTGATTPPSIEPAQTAVSYLAPDTLTTRRDVNRFTDPEDLSVNALGGAVVATDMGMVGWCANLFDTPCVPGQDGFADIHVSWPFFFFSDAVPPGLQEAVLGWSGAAEGGASILFEIPPGARDISAFDTFAFRTVPNPGYIANEGIDFQDLVVVFEDATGARVEVAAADIGNDALADPHLGARRLRHVIMNQIRFPLASFEGVDLTDIAAVELAFSRTERGVIDVSDMAFMTTT